MGNQNIIVIYQSKYGWTERYAKWIAEALDCDIRENKKTKIEDLAPYDTIIYGAGIYAGILAGTKKLFTANNEEDLKEKNLILFSVGMNDPEDAKNVYNIRISLGQQIADSILLRMQLFHLRGGIDYKNLSLPHRAMMAFTMHSSKSNKISEMSVDGKEIIGAYGKQGDMTSKETIEPIVTYIKELN